MPLPMHFSRSKKKDETAYSAVEVSPNRSQTDVSTQQSAPPVPGWPVGPQRVASAPLWIIADLLLLLMPIAFLALAALAYKLDGKELSGHGRKIQEVILLGPTLFPLAFAALAGRSLKKIALWRAQEGTSLGFLEHVIGSQSFVAAIGHAITLHSLNFLTLGLLVLWALSPLGGQSALRLVHETNSTIYETRPVFYADVDAPSDFPRQSFNEDALSRVTAVVSTSLLTADTLEASPIDTWNHPKIPRLEELEQAEGRNETNRSWYDVDRHANHSYASLTGVDVMNLSENGATNFTIPYEYMYFGCDLSPANNITTTSAAPGVSRTAPNWLTQMNYLHQLNNASMLQSGSKFNASTNGFNILGDRGFFIYSKGDAIKPETLIYGSRELVNTFYLFECSMKSVLVEANIICNSDSCGVGRLRRLNTPRSKRNSTSLPYDVVNSAMTTKYFITHIAAIGGDGTNSAPNPVDTYIYGAQAWGMNGLNRYPVHNWTELIKDPKNIVSMSHRLTRFANAFWDASRWPTASTRNDPFALKSLNQTSGEPPETMTMNRTEAVVMRQIPIYRADPGWVACLIICSSILLLLGILSFFLSLRIMVPDVFDYVSSFTRDNPYVNGPHGGSVIDGAERARLLRKLPVQFGDAEVASEVGYLTLRTVQGPEDCRQGRVRRDRMYR